MTKIPVELILQIGWFLDGPTLLASLQVCSSWYRILHPLIWTEISRWQWHHPSFPLCSRRSFHSFDDSHLSGCFSRVQRLEWHSNDILLAGARRHERLQHMKSLDTDRASGTSTAQNSWSRTSILRPQIHCDRMAVILAMTGMSLFEFRLRLLPLRFPTYGITIFRTLSQAHLFPRLRRMSLGPSRPQVKWEFDVQDLFPLFEQLEELEIQGTIFRLDFELLRRRYPSLDIPPRTLSRKILADSSMSDMTTYPPSSSHLPQWKVKRLLTPDDWMLMLAFCPDLSDLDLREVFRTIQQPTDAPLHLLLSCPRLERLVFWTSRGNISEMTNLLGPMQMLTTLECKLYSLDLLKALCDISQETHAHSEPPFLPSLTHLRFSSVSVEIRDPSPLLRKVLQTRSRLKTFTIQNFVVKLEALFIPQTSVSGDDNDSDLGDWACKDLETLSMQLSSSRDESVNARLMPRWPRREKDIPVPNEACIRRWGDVYRQLGQLTKLKTLVIFCNELHIALNIGDQANKGSLGGSGIEQLGGETGKMQQLETLALSDMMGVRWEFEVLEALLNMVPKLKSLYLRPLYSSNSQEIMQWLADMDRGDVVFESNAPILETP